MDSGDIDSIVMASEALASGASDFVPISGDLPVEAAGLTPLAPAESLQREENPLAGTPAPLVALVRRAVSADLGALVSLGQVCFPNDCWTIEGIQEELFRPNGIFRVVVSSQGVVGYLVAWQVLDELQILQIATAPSLQRQGIASLLLKEVLADVRHGGGHVALLEVRSSNSAARAFYEHHGFRILGIRRGYYAHPIEDAVLMVRDC